MGKLFYLSLIFTVFTTVAIGQNSSQQTIQDIEALVKEYASKNDVPAISMGLIIDNESFFINYGTHKRNTTQKTTENSIFQIASLGKLLTGVIINDLVQKGKIDLNESIVTYLPVNYSNKIQKKLQGITVRDLLHHRSALPRQSKVINRKNDEPIIYNYSEIDFKKDFEKLKLKSKPGEAFSYSNFGYAVLAYIAETVTDKSFDVLLKEMANQYGLVSTSINCQDSTVLVTPYREDNRKIETKNWILGKLAPPSGIYSSVNDLSKFLLAQLKVYHNRTKKDILFLTNDTRAAWDGTGIFYGYGMFDWGNGGFGHGGGMDGYGSEYWLNPESNIGFVFLTSSGGKWVTELSKEISKILIDRNK